MSISDPPKPSEVELSIFGRGIGESILLHLGDGHWIIVDSLREKDGRPTPLRYLESIDHSPADSIDLIVATHWHDDHIGGLSDVYASAPKAHFCLPIAMRRQELRAFQNRVRDGGSRRYSSGIRELDKVALLRKSERNIPLQPTQAHTILLERNADAFSHGQQVAVRALSPAPADTEAFLNQISQESEIEAGNRVEPFHPNHISIALWVCIGEHRLLLGADLETTNNPQRGWQAVANSVIQLDGKARIVKVPHHGSANAHHQPAWDRLVVPRPLSAVTTYNRGVQLPTDDDKQRLIALSDAAYMTSAFQRRAPRRLNLVESKIRDMRARVYQRPQHSGQVRFRLDLDQPNPAWTIALFNGAHKLTSAA